MPPSKLLKWLHVAGSAWFAASAGGLLVFSTLPANIDRSFTFGTPFWTSGYLPILFVVLLVLIRAAILNTAVSQAQPDREKVAGNSITGTTHYILFYNTSPFLGALAGCLIAKDTAAPGYTLPLIAIGTFEATFFVWLIIDPTVRLTEMVLTARDPILRSIAKWEPALLRRFRQRFSAARAVREKQCIEMEKVLTDLLAEEKLQQQHLQQELLQNADRLADLIMGTEFSTQAEQEAVDIALNAWRTGGPSCMRQLHNMAIERCKKKYHQAEPIDYISIWWDGIGNWRSSYPDEQLK